MLEKIKGLLENGISKLPSLSTKNLSMNVVYAIGGVFGFAIFLFFAGWLHEAYKTGHADLQILITFFERCLISSGAVLAFTWLGKALTDKNKNGIPDQFEETNNSDMILMVKRKEMIKDDKQNDNEVQRITGQGDRVQSVHKNRSRKILRPDQNGDPEI